MGTTKIIILDRDGVININSDNYIRRPEEWQPIPSSIAAIAKLTKLNYTICLATNQSGIGRGYFSRETLDSIHAKMHAYCQQQGGRIDKIFFCPHTPEDNCNCRKPKPGLIQQIAKHYAICQADLQQVPFVGDSLCDIQAAKSSGCRPILVKTGNGAKRTLPNLTPAEQQELDIYPDLAAFSDSFLQ